LLNFYKGLGFSLFDLTHEWSPMLLVGLNHWMMMVGVAFIRTPLIFNINKTMPKKNIGK
jgi:hypothetical protein